MRRAPTSQSLRIHIANGCIRGDAYSGLHPLIALLALALTTTPVCDAVWHDRARDRDVPVRIILPAGAAKVPVVIWSPGLGGDITSGGVWARDWAAAGLAVVQMQHAGSDSAVYREPATPEQRRARIVAGTAPNQLQARVDDARFVLSEISRRPDAGRCNLNRVDITRAAIAGHSMGAWVAQAIAGQLFGGKPTMRDIRFRAAVALSPTAPPGTDAFARVGIPFLSITGTRDGVGPLANRETAALALAQRSAAYQSMPADGKKCLLVFAEASHMLFAGNRAAKPDEATALHVETTAMTAMRQFLAGALAGKAAALTDSLAPVLRDGDFLTCK